MTTTPAIELRSVTKVFGAAQTQVKAIDDLSLSIDRGTFLSVMGPSGSGKSTLLHLIAGLTPPSAGHVFIDGQDIGRATSDDTATLRRRHVGYILQSFNLLPFLTAEANVAMPLLLDGVDRAERRERVKEAIARVGLEHRARHRAAELSGGEQQRVAIARALAIRPSIVLADEPTGSLDRTNGTAVMELLSQINETLGVTVVTVTHDPLFAAYAKHVIRLVDGKLEQTIDVEEAARASSADEL